MAAYLMTTAAHPPHFDRSPEALEAFVIGHIAAAAGEAIWRRAADGITAKEEAEKAAKKRAKK